MLYQNIVFSNETRYRVARHSLFWIAWWFYFGVVYSFSDLQMLGGVDFQNRTIIIMEIIFAFTHPLLAYTVIYFILPRLIYRGKYFKAFFCMACCLIFIALIHALILQHVQNNLQAYYTKLLSFDPPLKKPPFSILFFKVSFITLRGASTAVGFSVAIKLLKQWYINQRFQLQLIKEKAEAQLKLLTAQVNPHFLFNSLNNIYSGAQTESPRSAKMIMELSHIMRYVLDEGNQEFVPLENELQLIKDYINLEKTRYDEKLDLYMSFPPGTNEFYITPLLLLPFIENCFKHGASKMINNPWINLKIELQDAEFSMKLINGKLPGPARKTDRKCTGIENVNSRLELLYKENYHLQIVDEGEVFVVNLKMPLMRKQDLADLTEKELTNKES